MLHIVTTFAIFMLIASLANAQRTVDTVLTMSDGAKLELLYCVPSTEAPAAGYPGIVLVHGFQGSKENVRASAVEYAQLGYQTLCYSVRGQGGSEGEFDFFTSERILADLKAMIDFTKALPNANADRVAVMGGSQGGIHAWAAAAHHLGARTVVSIVANGRFEQNWAANNAMNWTFARTIALTTTRLVPSLRDSVNRATTSGDITWVADFLERHSTRELEEAVITPVLIAVSYFDGFFNPSAALRQFARVPAPKRIFLYPAGHAFPSDAPTFGHLNRAITRWMNYWLKDDPADAGILSEDSAVVMFDGATNEAHVYALKDSALWLDTPAALPPTLSARTWYLSSNGLSPVAPAQGQKVFPYMNVLGSTPVTFRTPPFAKDETIAGTFGDATLASDGTAAMYQLNLQLFDVDPSSGASLPVTRGHYEFKQNTSGSKDVATFGLNAVCHTIKAGHMLEARVHGGIPLVPNTANDFGNVVLGPVQNSTNTIYYGGAEPSRFTYYVIDQKATGMAELPLRDQPSLDVYPNPATGSHTGLRFSNTSRNVRINVYDNLGRIAMTIPSTDWLPGVHDVPFATGHLSAGYYHLVMKDGDRVLTRRLAVLR